MTVKEEKEGEIVRDEEKNIMMRRVQRSMIKESYRTTSQGK